MTEDLVETQQAALEVLASVNAIIADTHVVFASGLHGNAYVNKDAVYPYTDKIKWLCSLMAERHLDDNIEVVVAPEKGGIILAQWVADHLSKRTWRQVLAVYAEKETISFPDPEGRDRKCYVETGHFIFNRGYDKLVVGRRCLFVEDIFNTGGSAREGVLATLAAGGIVVAVVGLCNRGGVTTADIGVERFSALINITMEAWVAPCPLCIAGVPVNTEVGKGKAYLANLTANS